MDVNSEEKTILANIISLAQQLVNLENQEEVQGMEGNGENQNNSVVETLKSVVSQLENPDKKDSGDLVGKQMNNGEEEKKEEETSMQKALQKITKAIIDAGAQDAPSANDDAETRVEDGNKDTDDEAIAEVAKALLKLNGKKEVNKSQQEDKLDKVLKTLDSFTQRQNEVEKAVSGIIEGLGIVKPVKNQLNDAQKQLVLKDFIGQVEEATGKKISVSDNVINYNDRNQVRKSLCDVMRNLAGN